MNELPDELSRRWSKMPVKKGMYSHETVSQLQARQQELMGVIAEMSVLLNGSGTGVARCAAANEVLQQAAAELGLTPEVLGSYVRFREAG